MTSVRAETNPGSLWHTVIPIGRHGSVKVEEKAALLVEFVRKEKRFRLFAAIPPDFDYQYGYHMGAMMTDAVLQAGLNWETTVRPRALRVQREYPEARTLSGFLKLLQSGDPGKVIDWKHHEKIGRLIGATQFFAEEHVDTASDLRSWLETPGNPDRLQRVRGIGKKTVDYLSMQVGIDTNAPDRHLSKFLALAAVETSGYEETRAIINQAADLLRVDRKLLDFSIWKFVSDCAKKLRGRCLSPIAWL